MPCTFEIECNFWSVLNNYIREQRVTEKGNDMSLTVHTEINKNMQRSQLEYPSNQTETWKTKLKHRNHIGEDKHQSSILKVLPKQTVETL